MSLLCAYVRDLASVCERVKLRTSVVWAVAWGVVHCRKKG
jgi:hypothetical protein